MINRKKITFIKTLEWKLIKLYNTDDLVDKMRMILYDLVQYFRGRSRFKTTQQEIEYNMIFRGFIVKDWLRDGNVERFQKLNKEIVKEYILFYNACWLDRNQVYHSKEIQDRMLVEWSQIVKEVAIRISRNVK